MTVAVKPRRIDYLEDGATLAFAVPWRFADPANVKAVRIATTGARTTLAYGSGYSVTGGETDAGGELTLTVAGPTGGTLSIWSETPRGQTADYETSGTFPAETHEERLDVLSMVDQEQDEELGRALRVPRGEEGFELPARETLLGKALFVNAGGEVEGVGVDDFAAPAKGYRDQAEAAADVAVAVQQATARYFTSKANGEAGSAASQFFAYPDGAGGLIYAERTANGAGDGGGNSKILGQALTRASLTSRVVDRYAGVMGDLDYATKLGTNDAPALNAITAAMGVDGNGYDLATSVARWRKMYSRTEASITFPTGFVANELDGQGSRIFYRGAADASAAVFKITQNQFRNNAIGRFLLDCGGLAGYGVAAIAAGGGMGGVDNWATTQVTLEAVEVNNPTVASFQIGNQAVSGRNQDCANWTLIDCRSRIRGTAKGLVVDADDAFNINVINAFLGTYEIDGEDPAEPDHHLEVKHGAGVYVSGSFTGNNAPNKAAIRVHEGNFSLNGHNAEGKFIFEGGPPVGDRLIAHLTNVMCNDSAASDTPTTALKMTGAPMIADAALLGRVGHPARVEAASEFHGRAVHLGAYPDGHRWGDWDLERPERCSIDSQVLTQSIAVNANPRLNLWREDGLPIGYEISPLGECSVERSTLHTLYDRYTALVEITDGAAVSGQLIDGFMQRTQIAVNLHPSMKALATVFRVKVLDLVGTDTLQFRMTYNNFSDNPNGSNFIVREPDENGEITAILWHAPNVTDDPAAEVLTIVGTGVDGASATFHARTRHLVQMMGYEENGSQDWLPRLDVKTKYPAFEDIIEEYRKAGITARWNVATKKMVLEYMAAAPLAGRAEEGEKVWYPTLGAGASPGLICHTAGLVGAGALFDDLAVSS